jgi:hypothetical protein
MASHDPRDLASDLRLLKLAELYEEAYEGFIVRLATQVVGDRIAREGLSRLVDPSDRHGERIAELLVALSADLRPEDAHHVEAAALEDVIQVEESARDFYQATQAKLHDPRARELFQRLAQEEEGHARIARALLESYRKRHGLREAAPRAGAHAGPRGELGVLLDRLWKSQQEPAPAARRPPSDP